MKIFFDFSSVFHQIWVIFGPKKVLSWGQFLIKLNIFQKFFLSAPGRRGVAGRGAVRGRGGGMLFLLLIFFCTKKKKILEDVQFNIFGHGQLG